MVKGLVFGFSFSLLLASVASASVKSTLLEDGFSIPVAVVQDPTNPNLQFVIQQRGRIKAVSNGVTQGDFLNLVGFVSTTGGERGLLGMAFDPLYAINGYFYINCTTPPDHATRILRFQRKSSMVANAASQYEIMTIPQPYSNHNGGTLRFGPDGYLYIGMGDGGSGGDPENRAQTLLGTLLGKMLRIDIRNDGFPGDSTRNYAIPASNPLIGSAAEGEIWACGLRNPWKFSFDDPSKLGTGGMLIGDVGQNAYEEVNYEPFLAGGRNYGWREREGLHSTALGGWNGQAWTDPIWEYPRTVGQSITGGYVYRGLKLTGQFGRYFFADYVQGKVFSAKLTILANGEAAPITGADVVEITDDLNLPADTNISSIDVDSTGELFITAYGGSVLRIEPENEIWPIALQGGVLMEFKGGIRETLADDVHAMKMVPQTFADVVEPVASDLTFGFQTDSFANSVMRYTVIAKSDQATLGGIRVYLKNYVTGALDLQGTYTPTTAYQTFTKTGIAASSYRRGDGRIEMVLRATVLDPNQVFFNLVRMEPF